MKHSIPHDLSAEKAKLVAEKAIESYTEQLAKYEPKATWVNEKRADITFKAKGISLGGTIELADDSIDVDMDVPFLLRPFKGKAIEVVEREVNKWVAKAKAGEI